MRVTDNMVYGGSTDAMLNLQSSVAKLQQQVTQGTVLTPADDPVAAARALDLTQAQSVNTQFATNRANANSLLTSNESTISNIVTTITDIKSQVITAGNATYSNQDRQNIANTLKSDNAAAALRSAQRQNRAPQTIRFDWMSSSERRAE